MSRINDRTDNSNTNEAGEQDGDEQSTATILRPMTDDQRRTMGLSAIGFFRRLCSEGGLTDELEKALTTLEKRVMNPNAPSEEAEPAEPLTERTIARLAAEEPPPARSRFALRAGDGALLLSIEDMDARSLDGREIIAFMVLNTEEAAKARGYIDEALSDSAAHVIARLPKLAS